MTRILLLCSGGISTRVIVKKMYEAAKNRNVEVEIEAVSFSMFESLIDSYDIFLLGPQVKLQKEEFGKIAKENKKILDVIDFTDYGTMNGERILDFALSLKV